VRVEIITGFDRDAISDVVEARNTSQQGIDATMTKFKLDAIIAPTQVRRR